MNTARTRDDAGELREKLARLYYESGVYGPEPADVSSSTWRRMRSLGKRIARQTGISEWSIYAQAIEDAETLHAQEDPIDEATGQGRR